MALGAHGWSAAQTPRSPLHRPATPSSGISTSARPSDPRSHPHTPLRPLRSPPSSAGALGKALPSLQPHVLSGKLASAFCVHLRPLPSHFISSRVTDSGFFFQVYF
ncbi:unnamed protein product [Rangifer tarandus platyrhynchus]|uniref:Uncharacterized protein n=2 Tax=Rangifer tarandus platyrhynchus TaxID=3082113 RepID=A0AC59Y3Y7_RANTA|nr:unnamed protein product [Rangifer tarandus platyrhynchus]